MLFLHRTAILLPIYNELGGGERNRIPARFKSWLTFQISSHHRFFKKGEDINMMETLFSCPTETFLTLNVEF